MSDTDMALMRKPKRKDLDIHLLTQVLAALHDGRIVYLAIGTKRSEIRKTFADTVRVIEKGMNRKTE